MAKLVWNEWSRQKVMDRYKDFFTLNLKVYENSSGIIEFARIIGVSGGGTIIFQPDGMGYVYDEDGSKYRYFVEEIEE